MKLRRPCLSRNDFIIYLDKFEYDLEERECEPFIPLKGLYLKILLINIWIFILLLVYMWGVEGVTSAMLFHVLFGENKWIETRGWKQPSTILNYTLEEWSAKTIPSCH